MIDRWRRLAARWNPSCREMMRRSSRSLDQAPGRADRLIFAMHLAHCPGCRRARRQITLLVGVLRRLSRERAGGESGPLPGLPEAVRRRILDAIRGE